MTFCENKVGVQTQIHSEEGLSEGIRPGGGVWTSPGKGPGDGTVFDERQCRQK